MIWLVLLNLAVTVAWAIGLFRAPRTAPGAFLWLLATMWVVVDTTSRVLDLSVVTAVALVVTLASIPLAFIRLLAVER